MATIDQSRIKSGFDVEALLGERYLKMLLQTAFDAGMIPSSAEIGGTTVLMAMLNSGRLYEPVPFPDGSLPPTNDTSFDTTILFGHPLGANVKVRINIQPVGGFPAFVDLFMQLDVDKEFAEGSVPRQSSSSTWSISSRRYWPFSPTLLTTFRRRRCLPRSRKWSTAGSIWAGRASSSASRTCSCSSMKATPTTRRP